MLSVGFELASLIFSNTEIIGKSLELLRPLQLGKSNTVVKLKRNEPYQYHSFMYRVSSECARS